MVDLVVASQPLFLIFLSSPNPPLSLYLYEHISEISNIHSPPLFFPYLSLRTDIGNKQPTSHASEDCNLPCGHFCHTMFHRLWIYRAGERNTVY